LRHHATLPLFPYTTLFRSEGSEGAKISYTLYSGWKCKGAAFEFRMIAGFRPRQSWVKAVVLNDSMQRRTVLGHEQTHFDLAEVRSEERRVGKECGSRWGGA